ncbi:ABC transporter permease subunit [[Mycoplasma] gypis]|uniref:ABC transporter permease n=1 Tax=[Mycoplasma] gypis TaxID=92404 RepID=A0ABZ2RQ01_9BACT|nr:ABC transporter permease [[Mycoplasma] gypis]MBN0919558.1 ABC transporter permease [[Mycoplasma] gypis]
MLKISKLQNSVFWFLFKKILISFLVLVLINVLIFTILTILHPLPLYYQKMQNGDISGATKELLDNAYEKYGINKPVLHRIWDFFLRFFSVNFLPFSHVDSSLGIQSIQDTIPSYYFIQRNKYSYIIGLISLLFSFFLGYLLGVFAGYKNGTFWDYIINWFVIIFISISVLILIPIINLIYSSTGNIVEFNEKKYSTWILPIISLVLISMSSTVQIARNEVKKVVSTQYYIISKTIGYSTTQRFFKVVIKNSISPVLTLIPLSIISLFVSSIFLEVYYGVSGTWRYLYQIIFAYENEPICFLIMFLSFVYLVTYFITEVIKKVIDPYGRDKAC